MPTTVFDARLLADHSWATSATPSPVARTTARLPLVQDGRGRFLRRQLAREDRHEPGHIGLGGELESVHGLERLMILLAEGHLPLRCVELHALHRLDELL